MCIIDEKFKQILTDNGNIIQNYNSIYIIETNLSLEEVAELPCVTMVALNKSISRQCEDIKLLEEKYSLERY